MAARRSHLQCDAMLSLSPSSHLCSSHRLWPPWTSVLYSVERSMARPLRARPNPCQSQAARQTVADAATGQRRFGRYGREGRHHGPDDSQSPSRHRMGGDRDGSADGRLRHVYRCVYCWRLGLDQVYGQAGPTRTAPGRSRTASRLPKSSRRLFPVVQWRSPQTL
jgi:hypothetical protein